MSIFIPQKKFVRIIENLLVFLRFGCNSYITNIKTQLYFSEQIQVNLCQKLLFLHQLKQIVHWITSSIHENSELKPGESMLGTEIVSDIQNNFCTQHVLPMFCKKKSFWQRFPCTEPWCWSQTIYWQLLKSLNLLKNNKCYFIYMVRYYLEII